MAKHLTLSDRIIIERGLNNQLTFTSIARMLERSPSSISREVRRYRIIVKTNHAFKGNDCTKRMSCLRNDLCADAPAHGCYFSRCKSCPDHLCTLFCPAYESPHCERLEKPPYVCVGCDAQKRCRKNHAYYAAQRADTAYHRTVRDAHKGIRLSPEELADLAALIGPLIQNGQSLNHICATHADEIPVSEKTLYNYIDACVFKFRNLDLPKKVVYRKRRQPKVLTKLEYRYRAGRTYEDFKAFLQEYPDCPVTEMDTVKGRRSGGGKVLLTMILTGTGFMPVFLLPHCTQASVLAVFDHLTDLLGLETFRKLFPVFLTDNGVEFKDPVRLEFTRNGCPRTRVFFCDPQASWQKPHVENNHTLIRRIIPKGSDLNLLTSDQVHLLMRHLNSYCREERGNKTPFDLMVSKEQKKLLSVLELSPIPPDEVLLTPALTRN